VVPNAGEGIVDLIVVEQIVAAVALKLVFDKGT
jgi:hypothetical protein